MTTIINLFAGPGAGKSTTAARIFYELKQRNILVELVTEYAKDVTWEGHHNLLDDPLWITANQNRRLERLIGQVDYIVTDSPILLGAAYVQDHYPDSYIELLEDLHYPRINWNYIIRRTKAYQPVGRNQTEAEAVELDELIAEIAPIGSQKLTADEIVGDILKRV